jgi:3-oxoacyl-[acyl-carrier protein] reductase
MRLKDMEGADWDKLLKVHLYDIFHYLREALKIREAKNYGKIVSISSIAATVGLEGAPHYSAAKARNLDMSQAVLLEALTHKQAE